MEAGLLVLIVCDWSVALNLVSTWFNEENITEKDGQIFAGLDEHVEHFIGHIFDFISIDLMVQPVEDLFFAVQVA